MWQQNVCLVLRKRTRASLRTNINFLTQLLLYVDQGMLSFGTVQYKRLSPIQILLYFITSYKIIYTNKVFSNAVPLRHSRTLLKRSHKNIYFCHFSAWTWVPAKGFQCAALPVHPSNYHVVSPPYLFDLPLMTFHLTSVGASKINFLLCLHVIITKITSAPHASDLHYKKKTEMSTKVASESQHIPPKVAFASCSFCRCLWLGSRHMSTCHVSMSHLSLVDVSLELVQEHFTSPSWGV